MIDGCSAFVWDGFVSLLIDFIGLLGHYYTYEIHLHSKYGYRIKRNESKFCDIKLKKWTKQFVLLFYLFIWICVLYRKIMEKGAEQPWQEVLQEVIGEGRLDGSALREYFRPLEDWLRNENLRNNEFVGWIYDGDYCKHRLAIFLKFAFFLLTLFFFHVALILPICKYMVASTIDLRACSIRY